MRRTDSLPNRLLSSLRDTPATLRAAATVVWRCPLRTLRSVFVVVVSTAALIACGGDGSDPAGPDPLTIEDFVGSWSATSQVFTNNANPSETFDLIAAGGEHRVTMLTGGRTRSWIELGDFSDEWDALVTLNSARDMLTSTPEEASRPVRHYSFTLVGNTLTLTNTDDSFDFTLSGAEGTSATMVVVYQKTS